MDFGCTYTVGRIKLGTRDRDPYFDYYYCFETDYRIKNEIDWIFYHLSKSAYNLDNDFESCGGNSRLI